ncbi:MAG: FG-GAP-like repeat-containing protein [Planctomycetota bacterium]|jgi:hypothetical protein
MSGRFRVVIVLAVVLIVLGLPSAAEQRRSQVTDDEVKAALNLKGFSAQQLQVPAELVDEFEVDVNLDGVPHRLRLRSHSVRAKDFRLLVQGADGVIREVDAPPPCTYRGEVTGGQPGQVAASLVNGQIVATMLMDDGALWQMEPLSKVAPQADHAAHVVYGDADMLPLQGFCGTEMLEVPDLPTAGSAALGGPVMNDVVQLAFDGDYEYYSIAHNSSIPDATADINTITNSMDMIYAAQAGINYNITTILLRTSEPDPYTQFSGSALLTEFADQWNNNHGGVVRDLAHLMTGKDLGGVLGISFVGVVCISPLTSYALSQTGFTGNFAERVAVTAHEIGHNWNAGHCDGDIDCSLMCSAIGGCSGNISYFGSTALAQIIAYRGAIGCLLQAPFSGVPFIMWRHDTTGHNSAWTLDGASVATAVTLPSETNEHWTTVGTGDLDGDTICDILWRNTKNGRNRVWLFTGINVSTEIELPKVRDQNWVVAGTGDFNNDGMDDILWRHGITGNNAIWFMSGGTVLPGSGPIQPRSNKNWKVVGIGDFNNDGMDDILWRHKSRGKNAIWLMNGGVALPGSGSLTTVSDRDWTVVGVGDFDLDGMDDILWRHQGNGNNAIWFMDGRTILPASGPIQSVPNTKWQVISVGDIDGDAIADILWRHSGNGKNSAWLMIGSVIQAGSGSLPPLDVDWAVAGTSD